jgi:hypothetical protein
MLGPRTTPAFCRFGCQTSCHVLVGVDECAVTSDICNLGKLLGIVCFRWRTLRFPNSVICRAVDVLLVGDRRSRAHRDGLDELLDVVKMQVGPQLRFVMRVGKVSEVGAIEDAGLPYDD